MGTTAVDLELRSRTGFLGATAGGWTAAPYALVMALRSRTELLGTAAGGWTAGLSVAATTAGVSALELRSWTGFLGTAAICWTPGLSAIDLRYWQATAGIDDSFSLFSLSKEDQGGARWRHSALDPRCRAARAGTGTAGGAATTGGLPALELRSRTDFLSATAGGRPAAPYALAMVLRSRTGFLGATAGGWSAAPYALVMALRSRTELLGTAAGGWTAGLSVAATTAGVSALELRSWTGFLGTAAICWTPGLSAIDLRYWQATAGIDDSFSLFSLSKEDQGGARWRHSALDPRCRAARAGTGTAGGAATTGGLPALELRSRTDFLSATAGGRPAAPYALAMVLRSRTGFLGATAGGWSAAPFAAVDLECHTWWRLGTASSHQVGACIGWTAGLPAVGLWQLTGSVGVGAAATNS